MRNVKPLWKRYGTAAGVALGGLDMWFNQIFGLSPFGTLRTATPDYARLKPAASATPIVYPSPDGQLTFDKMSSVYLSGTVREEDQPIHLKLKDVRFRSPRTCPDLPSRRSATVQPVFSRWWESRRVL